jgi:hypothetical protein
MFFFFFFKIYVLLLLLQNIYVLLLLQNPFNELLFLSMRLTPDSATDVPELPCKYYSSGDCVVSVHFNWLP